ncbi:Branched-chain-amino-acid aminotransferase-like protein 2 [Tetrabaena socialis]|uniref:Branched-chain-amino-acid aminotransferase-like protein 2 n=1 Tax=Tetrabaena socialis TaxID=47790 RepID=A0A2J8A840_9CHLO|nr:Branched-chain-amino-acid aminotransferase-like protein 2 [Tetrabaena socialis]|eukprot:PNH08681.1 Branched-chain-amino-acid aminotransferase-like protein 2 [Tetrabaena socialis]
MYSFAQRHDTGVLDEPLYAHYLRTTGLERPYRDQVLAAQDADGNAVVAAQLLGPRPRPLLYAKHMGKHKAGLSNDIFRRAQHVVLVREPYSVLQSFSAVLEPTQQELGYTALLEIVSELRALGWVHGGGRVGSQQPIVVDSDELTRHPAGVLRALCAALGVPWDPAMLSWPAGPKPYDGLWADWWYRNTHKSTGGWLGGGGWCGGRRLAVWRPHACVSVLDSGYMLGDGVWEGIRLHKGCLYLIEEHLERLWEGCKALDMDVGLTQQQLQQLLYETVDANGMTSGVHIRLMVTRGLKPTPYQNPNITIGKPTIVIIPEFKEPSPVPRERGIRLFTVHVRRGAPDVQDPGLNSHSKLNCIAACIQANKAGADEALMLDPQGFVCTCNSTNFFIVRKGEVWAPSPRHQLRGITRARVLALCGQHGVPCRETDFYLTQVYGADEAFVTGTFAGVIPVVEVDGRVVGDGRRGPVALKLQQLHAAFVDAYCAAGRRAM